MTIFTASYQTRRLTGPGLNAPCGLGKTGVISAADKREGDGKSPLGVWPVREIWYRADRVEAIRSALPVRPLNQNDGWCDASGDPAYNQHVCRPYPASHEAMWREDGLYDVIVTLGHNDDPPVPGLGSAIFLHCCKYDETGAIKPTLGCVSIALEALIGLVERLQPGDGIEIKALF